MPHGKSPRVIDNKKQCPECRRWLRATRRNFHVAGYSKRTGKPWLRNACIRCCTAARTKQRQANPAPHRESSKRYQRRQAELDPDYYKKIGKRKLLSRVLREHGLGR